MKKHLYRLWKDDFIRHTGIMVVGLQLVNLFNLVFHLIMVRVLSYGEYGTLNALTVLSFYFCQFTPPFQPALTRFISQFIARGEEGKARFVYYRGLTDLGLLSFAIVIGTFIFSPQLASWQNVQNPHLMIAAGVLIAVNIMLSSPMAFLQGAQLFTSFAVINALSALFKVLIGISMLLLGFRLAAGLGAFISTPVFLVIVGAFVIHRFFLKKKAQYFPSIKTSMLPIYRYYLPTGIVLVSFTILTNMDVTLVKHFFSPQEAGYYSVAQMVGKIILFLPWAVSMVVFPKATTAKELKQNSFHLLLKGLALTGGLCGIGFLICLISPGLVLHLLTGKNIPQAVALVIPFASAMSLYSLVWLVVFYNLSIHNIRFILPLVMGAIIQTTLIYLYHPSLSSILLTMNIMGGLLLLVTIMVSKNHKTMAEFDRDIL